MVKALSRVLPCSGTDRCCLGLDEHAWRLQSDSMATWDQMRSLPQRAQPPANRARPSHEDHHCEPERTSAPAHCGLAVSACRAVPDPRRGGSSEGRGLLRTWLSPGLWRRESPLDRCRLCPLPIPRSSRSPRHGSDSSRWRQRHGPAGTSGSPGRDPRCAMQDLVPCSSDRILFRASRSSAFAAAVEPASRHARHQHWQADARRCLRGRSPR